MATRRAKIETRVSSIRKISKQTHCIHKSKGMITFVRRVSCSQFYAASIYRFSLCSRESSGMTVSSMEQYWTKKFLENNVSEAKISIKLILTNILGLKNVAYLEKVRNQLLTVHEYDLLQKKAALRLKYMPMQYILGEWDFCGLTLKMSPSVFIPRPETEDLVCIAGELICRNRSNKSSYIPHFLEIGCGSGAISLALLSKHNQLRCTAIDANPAAISLAKSNSKLLGFTHRASFLNGKLNESGIIQGIPPFDCKFEFIFSNPPYIPTSEVSDLAPEIVNYEDHLALDGGPDGTSIIESIVRHAPNLLKEKSFIVLEIDPRQTKRIQLISQESGSYIGDVDVRKDCFGVERFVILRSI